ncbi:hypothetical protein V8D89_012208 [Ganoderma adspersum]
MSSSAPNDSQNGTPAKPSLDADITLLQKLLSEDIDESNPENVAELLKRLEAAEGFAGGVEERLDGIMDHLDALLGDLETKQMASTVDSEMGKVEVRTVEVVTEVHAESDPAGQTVASK